MLAAIIFEVDLARRPGTWQPGLARYEEPHTSDNYNL